MSSNARRAEKQKEWAAEQERREAERNRIDGLSLYDRIEEFVDDEQLKRILHELAEKS